MNFEMEAVSETPLNNSLFGEFTWDKGLGLSNRGLFLQKCFFLIIFLCKYYPTPEHWKVYTNSPHFLFYIILEGFSWRFIACMGALFTIQ